MSNIHELIEQKNRLQAEIDAIKNSERQSVIDSVKASIAEFKLTASELGLRGSKKGPKGPAVDKYQHGGNRWSGRGLSPKWVKDLLEARGITIEEFKELPEFRV